MPNTIATLLATAALFARMKKHYHSQKMIELIWQLQDATPQKGAK